MSGPGGLNATEAAAAVTAGRVRVEDLLADAQRRLDAWEPWLGALVARIDRPGHAVGPLAGVVVGVKELLAVAGLPLTCGAPDFLDDATPSPADATVVARVHEAGASLLATLASHALAYGIITPQTRNPRAPDRVAGGSSGGVAAAIAAGAVHLGLGTDTGGSVRIPAACCGVVGLKTTRGRVPREGLAELATSLDTIGPLAATVADTMLALQALSPGDGQARPPRRIGIPEQLAAMPIDPEVRAVWGETVDELTGNGVEVVEVDLPHLLAAHRANGVVIAAEAYAVHGERFATHGHLLPASTRTRLERGAATDAARVGQAREVAAALESELQRCFEQVDLLCTPTLPCRVPAVDVDPVVVDGVEEPVVSAMTRLVGPWNLVGVPAGSVPAGHDDAGAPVGVQLVGPPHGDEQVLAGMALVEQLRGGAWPAAAPVD